MIKIDRSFVEPLGSDQTLRCKAIVEAVIALTGSLALDVVAEGIETQAQRQALIDMGCTYGQGFLFGRPQAAGHWLAT
jgi:EAL domain-containing protein (putative c-di-GMP-specific phosphodiesterase class I)